MILRFSAVLLGLALLAASRAPAQEADSTTRHDDRRHGFATLGSLAEARLRMHQLLGLAGPEGFLLRSASSLAAAPEERTALAVVLLPPALQVSWNSAMPYSSNDGGLWAGRGFNTRVRAGMRFETRALSVILAPELTYAANEEFALLSTPAPDRSALLPPWRRGIHSADLPLRFGETPSVRLDPGQSSVTLTAGKIAVGAATENQWWGPGIRNALLLSNNAPGFPHAFVRSSTPLETAAGQVEGRWILGALTESPYFDASSGNDLRALNAAAVTFRPRFEPGLAVGLARAVYAAVEEPAGLAARSADVLTRWSAPDEDVEDGWEQITTLFWRWNFPADHLEFYGEWGRTLFPESLDDLLATPYESQGYTLGLQWARPMGEELWLRLQSELTYLEQTGLNGEAPRSHFYTSARVPQGYTHRGQVIGAAIGPGASSQWLAADYIARRWQVGAFAGRIRWDNDAFYTTPTGVSNLAHDVSIFGGIRGGGFLPWAEVSGELTYGKRMNFLFQNGLIGWGPEGATDVTNLTFTLGIVPRAP